MKLYIDIILVLKDGVEILVAAYQPVKVQALTNMYAIDKLNKANYAYKLTSKKFGKVFDQYRNRIQRFYCIESNY